MSRFRAVVGELHHLFRAAPVTLLDVVRINPEGPVAVHRSPEHLGPCPAVHRLQIAAVHLTIEAVAKVLEVVSLEIVDVVVIRYVVTHVGTHAR